MLGLTYRNELLDILEVTKSVSGVNVERLSNIQHEVNATYEDSEVLHAISEIINSDLDSGKQYAHIFKLVKDYEQEQFHNKL